MLSETRISSDAARSILSSQGLSVLFDRTSDYFVAVHEDTESGRAEESLWCWDSEEPLLVNNSDESWLESALCESYTAVAP